jgi:hypothetical protein
MMRMTSGLDWGTAAGEIGLEGVLLTAMKGIHQNVNDERLRIDCKVCRRRGRRQCAIF